MQNFFEKQQSPDKILEEIRVREYINKYIKEVQRHFDMPDEKMRSILLAIYKDLSPVSFIKNFIKSRFSMVKSKYRKIMRRK